MAGSVQFEDLQRIDQARRSKVKKEVLIRFRNSQTRDLIQSYAPNLAAFDGTAGLRMEAPDFLRGLFRLFEAHGAALRAKYTSVKRSIRFDDVEMSLFMDVKLRSTQWHRITGAPSPCAPGLRERWHSRDEWQGWDRRTTQNPTPRWRTSCFRSFVLVEYRSINTKKGEADCWQVRLTGCVLENTVTCQLEKVWGRKSKKRI